MGDVPRRDERIGPVNEDDLFTFKKEFLARPSRELEDLLTGITLRIAKERFGEREWDSPHLVPVEITSNTMGGTKLSEGPNTDSTDHPASYQLHNLQIVGESHEPSQSIEQVTDPDMLYPEDIGLIKKSSEEPLQKVSQFQHPVVSSNDERSRDLLRPTIRHSLSRLDELLLALHYARQTCVRYGSDQTDSQTEADEASESSESSEEADRNSPNQSEKVHSDRKLGRPSKVLDIPVDGEGVDTCEAPKMTRRGRPRKVNIPFQNETHNEMLVRLARANKQKLPFQSASNPTATSRPARRRRRSVNKDAQTKRLARLGPRDWSEVLGTAALVGFSPEVISRATQRCATLFGEGMTMHSLIPNPRTESEEDETLNYIPETVQELARPTSSDSNPELAAEFRNASERRRRRLRSKSIKADEDKSGDEERDGSDLEDNFWCSYRDCPRHEQGFSKKWNLISHLMNAHRLAGNELEEALKDSDDEMLGGVHVDRFMKDIKSRRGWRGQDSSKRARSKSKALENAEVESEIE